MTRLFFNLFLLISIPVAIPVAAHAQLLEGMPNRFDISKSSIPKEEIIPGGPPRDGIPAIFEARFESALDSNWLNDEDLVAGIDHDGIQKAYPIRILVWHEAVNDEIKGVPILVSYCPLCGSILVFSRRFGERTLTFGISGLLYQSDVLFYDHQTESLWSQLEMKAVTGRMMGERLKTLPYSLVTWKEWRTKHPETLVLSRDTGYSREYDRDPYAGYESTNAIYFPIKHSSDKFHPKEKVIVVISGDVAKAYPFSELKNLKSPLEDRVGGKDILITFKEGNFSEIKDASGNRVESFVSYWFAWYTFRPDTLIYEK
jgi:hypothetical protein